MAVSVKRAFSRYAANERPWKLVEKDWYVVGPDNALYPAKYVWALAIGQTPKSFNTRDARRELSARGYSLISERNLRHDGYEDFERKLRKSLQLTDAQLQARLNKAAKIPSTRLVTVRAFVRNPDVVAAVLKRAAGKCERCGRPAPFIAASDGRPYLEVHHNTRLADHGEDTVANAVATCPNCHRQAHYG